MKLHDCFPTTWSLVIFLLYMTLFINQGLLVTATKVKGSNAYNYNTITVVMMIEVVKLIVSTSIYLKEFPIKKLFEEAVSSYSVLLLYFVPATLYSLYNNLTFENLSVFDPTTYYLLLQFRVVVTGVVFQVLFKKKLSRKQWISLVLLTLGCIVKQLHVSSNETEGSKGSLISLHLNFHLILVLVQVFCSCFAGVYNEYLLKDAGAKVHIMLQNIFMYVDCIVCNLVILLFKGQVFSSFSYESMSSLLQPLVLAVIFNGAACGIITSLFLRSLNSIMKTFASALELVFTAVLAWIIFSIPVDSFTALSIAIVSYATYLYSQNPVSNPGKLERATEDSSDEMEKMVSDNSKV